MYTLIGSATHTGKVPVESEAMKYLALRGGRQQKTPHRCENTDEAGQTPTVIECQTIINSTDMCVDNYTSLGLYGV